MPPAGIPASRALPSRESTLFKEVLHYYEDRQLKKGLKAADTILKKFPNHGETLCMKGLILTHMGRRDEGLELVKQGVRYDLTSHICWHVFGLIQKGQKNYEEALKSYTQALRFDKENMNILRDAAHLQTQLRHYDALVETRHTLLRLRPQLRQNWIALAVAYHLSGNILEAKHVLEQFERIVKNVPDYDVEMSEILLYHVRVLEELGEHTEALALLDTSAKSRAIIDRVAIMEFRARLLSKLGSSEAQQAWQGLIDQNADSYDYYKGFLSNNGIDIDALTEETQSQALTTLRDFAQQFPRAAAPLRLALTVATGDEFKELVEPYLRSRLEKGVPSLFTDLKALYRVPEKRDILESVAHTLLDSLTHAADAPCPPTIDPTMYVWTLYFLAQHHSHLGQHEKALELLDTAIAHTPTLPELYMFRGRVLKRCGDPFGAARWVDQARLLDLQDRFLNARCGKYRLRAGLVEESVEVFGLFTKKDAPSPSQDLEDMQSLLYLTEEADAQLRNGNYAMALKKYTAIQKVFDDFEDDQYDFHGYSVRKFTVNIYLNLLKWEDTLRSHPQYVHAAIEASRILVRLHDDPSIATSASQALSDAEKKAKKKAKKAEKKVLEEAKKAPGTATNEDKGLDASPPKDDDPDGSKLLQAPEPLERAAKWLKPLNTLAAGNIEAWIAIYDVAVRRKKYTQALQALTHAHTLDADSPTLHVRLVDFKKRWSSLAEKPSENIAAAVSPSLSKLVPDELSLERFNSQYLQNHSSRGDAILATAQALRILDAPREEVESAVFSALNADVELRLETAVAIDSFLLELKSPRVDEFRAGCQPRFGLATLFAPRAELPELRKNAIQRAIAETNVEKDEVIS
ncbi:N-alpha-acetyltransferase 16, NatA auxiliary subunit [Trametes pubescens]|uniref:N-alpha-acetyltransferase 16, NatA auxiliary subunit n=1 Tax=Trametes pubescens TaxID=154538 RepID=A0A1M2VYN7_TRAPU|nr:N-alpha-acetyltransferase 16, NatA auxiliary subunit [Trametes pubescens]